MLKVKKPTWGELKNNAQCQEELARLDRVYNSELAVIKHCIKKLEETEQERTERYEEEHRKLLRKYGR